MTEPILAPQATDEASPVARPLEGDVIRQQIAQRSAKLVAIARELKSELFGIDDVIDRVIESVRAWYVLPQIITRPVIICLWGLTGTGKTQLTRSLAQKLDFYSRFVEVQMDGFSNDSGRRSQSISGMLAETIEQGEAGILVLDEFQRFRTVDAQGKDVKVERYMDVWALLSDGRLAPALSFMQDLQMTLADAQYREDRHTSRRASAASNPFAHSAFADGHAFDEDDDGEVQDGAAPFEAGEPERLPLPAVPKFRLSPYEAKEFKNTLKLKEPLTDIMSWSSELVMQRLQAFCNDPSAWETDYSKLLIFICGNLDEMYTDLATRVEDCDTDADIFHAMTTQLSVIDVKRALMHRFKPEQIARLGNCHIIYPSFSRATFEKLVVSAAEQHLAGVRTTSGLQFSLSPALLDQLYVNGVFPSQGTRPLFSSIHGILSGALVHFTLWAMEQGACAGDRIAVDIEDVPGINSDLKTAPSTASLIAVWNDKTCMTPVSLEISRLKQRGDDDYRTLLAVHEAGHALVYLLLMGRPPVEIKINPATYAGGYNTFVKRKAYTASNMLDAVCVELGGRAAELLVFGKDHVTSGAVSDLKHATQSLAEYVRYCGFADRLSRTDRTSDESDNVNTDMAPTNLAMEALLQEQYLRAQALLAQHRESLVRIAQTLHQHGELTRAQLCAWFQLDTDADDGAVDPFAKMLRDFVAGQ